MGNPTDIVPGIGNEDGFQVPDTTGGQQVPDSIPAPQPVPEPEEKDEPGRPGPLIGPSGF